MLKQLNQRKLDDGCILNLLKKCSILETFELTHEVSMNMDSITRCLSEARNGPTCLLRVLDFSNHGWSFTVRIHFDF